MLGSLPIPAYLLKEVSSNGSPFILKAVGRAFGLGTAEQAALTSGKIPGWFLVVVGVTAGVVVGIQVHKRWPQRTKGFGG